MLDVRVEDFEERLSWYLEKVRRGESLAIRDHDNLVARILPPDSEPTHVSERILQMVAAGTVTLKAPPKDLPEPVKMLPGEKTAVDYVLEQRR